VRKIREEEFRELVSKYEKLIYTICYSFTKNYFDAEDLAQETFLSAYKHLASLSNDNPKAYLTAIAANKCRDFLKSPSRKTDSLTNEELSLIEDCSPSPEEELIQRDTNERLHRLCIRLKEPYRTIATDYFCKGKKLSEMSRESGRNQKTLETQLYRAKKLLRAMWREEEI